MLCMDAGVHINGAVIEDIRNVIFQCIALWMTIYD